jgi:hypothetical protein
VISPPAIDSSSSASSRDAMAEISGFSARHLAYEPLWGEIGEPITYYCDVFVLGYCYFVASSIPSERFERQQLTVCSI